MKSIILALSFLCLAVSVTFFLLYFIDGYQARQEKEELIRKKTATETAISDLKQPKKKEILPQYKALYEENPDLIGWVKIDGTPLDYPVMQNEEDKEYYLHRNFNREYEYSGLPFLDHRCDISETSTNLIIYGHNMKSDSMFSCLLKYRDKDYYFLHPVIRFDTIYEESEYLIIAVIQSEVFRKSDDVFKFYNFIRADTEEEFNEYIKNMKQLSLYSTGTGAVFGDQLLTLVTCSYHTENGRFAVLAKKIRDRDET